MNILLADIKENLVLRRITLVSVFLISLFFILFLQHAIAPLTKDGVHFQGWTSDTLVQSLNSAALRQHPFKSLLYLHNAPPLYDAIRSVLVSGLQKVPDQDLLTKLDQSIYRVWAVFFGLMAVLIYHWLSQLINHRWAFYLSMIWILHPSPIYYATYLDPTILVSLGVLWFFYELWLIYCRKKGSITRLTLAAVSLFYLRVTFPWFFFVLVAGCLMLMKIPQRKIVKFLVISVLLIAPYMAKQYFLFKVTGGTFSGKPFYFLVAGNNLPKNEVKKIAASIPWTYPKEAALSFGRLHTEKDWRENFAYHQLAREYMKAHPIKMFKNIAYTFSVYNWKQYWRSSSTFQPNTAVRRLPWHDAFNRYTAYPINFILLIFAFLLWRKARKQAGLPLIDGGILAITLLLGYIFLTSTLVNGNGRGLTEAVRYKFYLEPLYYMFVACQFYFLVTVNNTASVVSRRNK